MRICHVTRFGRSTPPGPLYTVRRTEFLFLVAALLALTTPALAAPSPVRTQSPDPGERTITKEGDSSKATSREALLEKRAAATARLDELMSMSATRSPSPLPDEHLLERRALLEDQIRAYDEQIDESRRLSEVLNRRRQLDQGITGPNALAEPPPYSIQFTDRLWDAAYSLARTVDGIQSQLSLTESRFDRVRARLGDAEERLRQALERFESSRTDRDRQRAQQELQLARLRHQAAGTILHAVELSKKRLAEELAEARARLDLARRQLASAEAATHLTEDDVKTVTTALTQERHALETELQDAMTEHRTRADALRDAERRLATAHRSLPASTPPQKRDRSLSRLKQDEALARARYDNLTLRVDLFRQLLDIVEGERQLWDARFTLTRDPDPARAQTAYSAFQELSRNVQAAREYLRQELVVVSGQIGEGESRMATMPSAARSGSQALLDAHRARKALYTRVLQRLDASDRFLERWKAEFMAQRRALPLTARLADAGQQAWNVARRLWQLEVFAAEDTIEVEGKHITGRRSVTVGKILSALAILIVGYWLCLLLARLIARIAAARFRMASDLTHLVRQWVQALLFTMLILVSFMMVKIPLTIFAFLGGAFAIGVGFGAQNLLKNVISGMLLLIERPLRVGDLIEVDHVRGRVTTIGLRSSTVRDAQGIETLIPNSNFLDRHLTNWTYSSHATRFSLRIGIPYGTPAEEIRQLLLKIMAEHPRVMTVPQPQVLLEEFGDRARLFVINYWLDIQMNTDAAEVASELRFLMEKRFMEMGMKILPAA